MQVEENTKYKVECDNDGVITIIKKKDNQAYHFRLFNDKYQYLCEEWCVKTRLFFSPNLEYLIVTYGIGYVYIINLLSMEVVRSFKLFPEVSYEDNSYQKLDLCCYIFETTEVDFSPSGRYGIIRVRGDYDPQEGDGRAKIFTPIYFSSVFLLDLQTLEITFRYDGSDMEEGNWSKKNMAVIAMAPSESKVLIGALGNDLKLFDINGTVIQTFKELAWIPDPDAIQKCQLALFIDENNLAYLNRDYNIVVYSKQIDETWTCQRVIDTGDETTKSGEKRKKEIRTLEYDGDKGEFVCDLKVRYK